MAINTDNKEVYVASYPGSGSMDNNPVCTQRQYVVLAPGPTGSSINTIWVYGVKPPNGTPGVARFSTQKWSQYDS